jgi:adenylosuccinate synthase
MTEKVFDIRDLGPGDGGKGGIVHAISSRESAHTIIKVGGAQGSHGVKTASGQKFNFSHFGCGTFEGVKTHISKYMVVEPLRFLYEASALQYEWGIRNIFDYLTVDKNALCITPFHTFTSRLRELSRKESPKGTVGIGAGEAVVDSELFPELAIRVKDLGKPYLRKKLEGVRDQKIQFFSDIIKNKSNRTEAFLKADHKNAEQLLEFLTNPEMVTGIVNEFSKMASLIKVVDGDYLRKEILSKNGTAIIESSHGVLTDRYYGFHPHTTQLRAIPQITRSLLKECEYGGELITLGVTRAYQIRHGAGPMVTESPEFLEKLLPGSNKDENRWQGKVRVGALDLVALRYAINVCGGPNQFNGLAISWADQILMNNRWSVCHSYKEAADSKFFTSDGEIKVHHGEGIEQFQYQETLGNKLCECRPDISEYLIGSEEKKKGLIRLISKVLENKLDIPVKMISFGATENDKVYL